MNNLFDQLQNIAKSVLDQVEQQETREDKEKVVVGALLAVLDPKGLAEFLKQKAKG